MNTPTRSTQPAAPATPSSRPSLEEEMASALNSTLNLPPVPKPTTVPSFKPITEILAERGEVHGDYSSDASHAQMLKDIMHLSPNWEKLNHMQRESLEHIATKIGRICVGNPNHKDHWEDIAGYAILIAQRL